MRFPLLIAGVLIAAAAVAADRPAPAPRTLDTVAIEGEIDVPQVLFISSRDHLRFRDDTGARLRPDALAVIRGAILPLRLAPAELPAAPAIPDSQNDPADVRTGSPSDEVPRTEKE
jgi:hypothetical protein